MERQDIFGGAAENTKTASGTTTATATQPAPGVGLQLVITGFSVSFGVASAGTNAAVFLRRNAGNVTMRAQSLPTGSMNPWIVEFKRPLFCGDNEDASLVVTGATNATLVLELYTVTRPTSANQITPNQS